MPARPYFLTTYSDRLKDELMFEYKCFCDYMTHVERIVAAVREHAPVPIVVADIIARYGIARCDLLELMPRIWTQDDDEPYTCPVEVFKHVSFYIHAKRAQLRVTVNAHQTDIVTNVSMRGADSVAEIINGQNWYGFGMSGYVPMANVRPVGAYYERIAARCEEFLFRARPE